MLNWSGYAINPHELGNRPDQNTWNSLLTNKIKKEPIIRVGITIIYREIKLDVTWSYVKRQTAKMKLLPSVFSSLNSRMKIFVFVANSRRHFSNFYVIQ